MDSDNDGVGDNADAFPNDPTETVDSDNDGVGDNGNDAFPNDPAETVDSDGMELETMPMLSQMTQLKLIPTMTAGKYFRNIHL